MTIHENLRNLRLAANMTQKQAAEQLGITRQGLSSYETGRTLPDIETLKSLATLYDTDLESLINGPDKKSQSYHTIKKAAVMLYIALAVLTFISSAVLWTANRFFAMPSGQMTDTAKQVFEIRTRLLTVWELADSIILAIIFLSGIFFLIYCAVRRCRYRLKDRLVSVALCAGTILLIAFVFGISDHVYSVVDYFITPFSVIARLCLFLLSDILIEKIQKRRTEGGKR